jgi:hypothetical protein
MSIHLTTPKASKVKADEVVVLTVLDEVTVLELVLSDEVTELYELDVTVAEELELVVAAASDLGRYMPGAHLV